MADPAVKVVLVVKTAPAAKVVHNVQPRTSNPKRTRAATELSPLFPLAGPCSNYQAA